MFSILDQYNTAAIDDRKEHCYDDYHILKAVALDPWRKCKDKSGRDCEFDKDNSNETVSDDLRDYVSVSRTYL